MFLHLTVGIQVVNEAAGIRLLIGVIPKTAARSQQQDG
jgi:hypothetical protein